MGGFSAAGALCAIGNKVINNPKPINSHFSLTLAISASSFLPNIQRLLAPLFLDIFLNRLPNDDIDQFPILIGELDRLYPPQRGSLKYTKNRILCKDKTFLMPGGFRHE
jgi:hypothetical protein